MRRVGYLSSKCILEGPSDGVTAEHDRQVATFGPPCERRGIALEPIAWDEVESTAGEFAAFVLGSTWDYTERPTAFVETLTRLARRAPLLNPLALVRWNLAKTYLRELADRGIPTIPTLWVATVDEGAWAQVFDAIEVETIVVKPVIGASSWRQCRVERHGPRPGRDELPPGAAMIQPFVSSVATEGEVSFVFFGGELSHAVRKLPTDGDYRTQVNFGGRSEPFIPTAEDRRTATRVIEAIDVVPLYARVDLIRGDGGEWWLIELELVEPYLYPEHEPECGERFAEALASRLDDPLATEVKP